MELLDAYAAGRDALRILERLSKDNYNFYSWVYRAASYAALGRAAEAKAARRMRFQHFPDLTIEGFTGTADKRCRPNPAHRADAGRGVPALRETRYFGEKPAIGAPA